MITLIASFLGLRMFDFHHTRAIDMSECQYDRRSQGNYIGYAGIEIGCISIII